jgi:predicted DNA binding CopG/RHH family protein
MKNKLELPEFANEDEEREFWAEVDLSDYFVPDDFVPVSFPNLKPTSRAISIRFPEYVLDAVKVKANEMGVPYQALIKEAVIKAYVTNQS